MTQNSKLKNWIKLTSLGVVCSVGGLFIYHYTQTFAQSTGVKKVSSVVHETEISKAVDKQIMSSLPSKKLEQELDVNPISYENVDPTTVPTTTNPLNLVKPPNQNKVVVPSDTTIIQPAGVVTAIKTKPAKSTKSTKPIKRHPIFVKVKKPIVHSPVKAKPPTTSKPKPTTPTTSKPKPTTPTTSKPKPTTPTTSKPKPTTSKPTKPKAPYAVQQAFPGTKYFKAGAKNKYVTQLGYMLVAAGYGKYYKEGPGPEWTSADLKNCQAFQRSQGWTGSDADGYPGPETWKRLYNKYYSKYQK